MPPDCSLVSPPEPSGRGGQEAGGSDQGGPNSGCELQRGDEVAVGVMVAPMEGKSFVPLEFLLRVVSQEEWRERPVFYGPAAHTTKIRAVARFEVFLTIHARSVKAGSCLHGIRVVQMPQGALVAATLPPSGQTCALNRSVDFRWTPSDDEVRACGGWRH